LECTQVYHHFFQLISIIRKPSLIKLVIIFVRYEKENFNRS
jgi:hypothetical protein